LAIFFPVATALISFLAVKILGQSLASLQAAGWLVQTPLGFGSAVEGLGFSPTWETAVPQVVLMVVLGVLTMAPLLRPKPGR
jgi:high-affinity iron transporter